MRGGIVAENSTVWRLAGSGVEDRLDVVGEAHVEHLVGLVEDDDLDVVERERAAADVIDARPGRGDDDVHAAVELSAAGGRSAGRRRSARPSRRAGGRT